MALTLTLVVSSPPSVPPPPVTTGDPLSIVADITITSSVVSPAVESVDLEPLSQPVLALDLHSDTGGGYPSPPVVGSPVGMMPPGMPNNPSAPRDTANLNNLTPLALQFVNFLPDLPPGNYVMRAHYQSDLPVSPTDEVSAWEQFTITP